MPSFGNTLEKLSLRVFGVKQRGSKEDPPMSHATGIGYVAKRDGDYSDAIVNKKLKVHMLLMETLGGISPGGVSYLGKLAGLADPAARGSRDSTAYVCLLECPYIHGPSWHARVRRTCARQCTPPSRRRPSPQDL